VKLGNNDCRDMLQKISRVVVCSSAVTSVVSERELLVMCVTLDGEGTAMEYF
jgi:hypothetical protein